MKKILVENWFKIVILILLLGLFYWYEIRVSLVVKKCSILSVEQPSEQLNELSDLANKKANVSDAEATAYYKRCLKQNGVGK